MGEPKAFASLSSGLLARKGAARPAMRPQGFGQVGAGLDDLGWNDMGYEAPRPALAPVRDDQHDAFGEQLPAPSLRNPIAALTPISSPVHDQQAEIAGRFADCTDESDGEDYVDETAELYDPEAPRAEAGLAPVLAIKPVRPVIAAVASQPIEPVVATPARATPVRAPRPRAAAGSKAKAAFTLRLDSDRHLKLRLACAVSGRSAQQLVTEALDQLLGAMPELDSMADRAPKQRANG